MYSKRYVFDECTDAYNMNITCTALLQKLSVWFESVVRCLAENQDIQPFKKLVSATAIIFSMQQSKTLFMPRDPKTVLLPLAEMLSLHPEIEDEYQRLCTYIPKNLRYITCHYNLISLYEDYFVIDNIQIQS